MDFFLNKIDKHLDNHRSLDLNMDDLKRKLKELNAVKEDIECRMSAELRPRKKLKTQVKLWLENVERIDAEIQSLVGRIGESSVLKRGFHAEDVFKRKKEVEQHILQGKSHEGLVVDDTQWIGQVLSTTTLSGGAAKACMEEIWMYLMDDEVRRVGVCGMGGVGKTSIMKLVNNQLLKETESFDSVIWITVSKETSVAKLQKDIASKLGITFSSDEDEITRAGMLFEILSRKSRFVMILDDLWDKISLEVVGIPEPSRGSKLIWTTRSFDVCRHVGCDRVIKVNPLVEEEAWNLFLEKIGGDILNIPGLEPVAKSIAKRCEGLPLGIITIAACMRGIYELSEWRNALKELSVHITSTNGLEDEVYRQLRFSYDRLKDRRLQRCFLTCALYREDRVIKESRLIHLWVALGLVEEMDSKQEKFDRGRAIMNRLVNNFLLEVVTELDDRRCVKMHDLVRDMALRITSGTPRFLVKAGVRLTEPPDAQEWSRDLEKVSLMENHKLKVFYPLEMSPPNCPRLTTLLLSDCGIERVPEGFFKHTCELKILDLSRNRIKSLPNSLSDLKNLTSLLLSDCQYLEEVPSLSKLGVLKVLNLKATNIKEIPHGMEKLSSLKYLNLNFISNLHEISNGILSQLSCLECLIVGEASIIGGEVVHALKKLEFLDGRFDNLQTFNMYVQLQAATGRAGLQQYIIRVGERALSVQIYSRQFIELRGCKIHDTNKIMLPRATEELVIRHCNLDCSQEDSLFPRFIQGPFSIFSSLKELYIYNCIGMKKLFSPNCMLPSLEALNVTRCGQLEEIIASETERDAMEFRLPQLEQLTLENLPELKSICGVNGSMVCDSLENIVIVNCPKLRRMPVSLDRPLLDNIRQSLPVSLRIDIKPKEWWESVEWHRPEVKFLLKPYLRFMK